MATKLDELNHLKERVQELPPEAVAEIERLRHRISQIEEQLRQEMSAWDQVQLARHENRPYSLDYIQRMFDSFHEIHGDRRFADDPAIVAGLAVLEGRPFMVIGQQKGRLSMKDRQYRNYGMANPEGYRKAIRLMALAEKFDRPILTLVDTPGAYPGLGAEERGQAEAIAYNLRAMARLTVPVIVAVIGEGGSGGALALGVGDRVLMLEHSIYSVISPESCSAILWKDQEHAREAAEALKLTARDLLHYRIIDEIVPEPAGGAHNDWDQAAALLKGALVHNWERFRNQDRQELLRTRFAKFRRMGEFLE